MGKSLYDRVQVFAKMRGYLNLAIIVWKCAGVSLAHYGRRNFSLHKTIHETWDTTHPKHLWRTPAPSFCFLWKQQWVIHSFNNGGRTISEITIIATSGGDFSATIVKSFTSQLYALPPQPPFCQAGCAAENRQYFTPYWNMASKKTPRGKCWLIKR